MDIAENFESQQKSTDSGIGNVNHIGLQFEELGSHPYQGLSSFDF